MTLVETNPQLANKNSKHCYYTVEDQSTALQQYINPILAKRGRESGNPGMRKKFKSPQASIALPMHPHSLPLHGEKDGRTEPSHLLLPLGYCTGQTENLNRAAERAGEG